MRHVAKLLIGAGVAAATAQGAQAQSAGSPEWIAAEIARKEREVADLRRLAALREEEAQLRAATGLPAAEPQPAQPKPKDGNKQRQTPAGDNDGKGGSGGSGGNNGDSSLGGIKFGAGIGFTYDLGTHDRIKAATVANGIVRVTEEDNVRARLLLESHYFFLPNATFFGLKPNDWGVGPFIALQGGPEDIVQGVGGGLMIGLKRVRTDPDSRGGVPDGKSADVDGSSFNLGFGVFYDLGVQTLGDGIAANQPLPPGETEIRFAKRSQSGFIILSSFAF
jgi:opacity protein-like surface antigen